MFCFITIFSILLSNMSSGPLNRASIDIPATEVYREMIDQLSTPIDKGEFATTRYRINCAGAAYIDSVGRRWSEDHYFSNASSEIRWPSEALYNTSSEAMSDITNLYSLQRYATRHQRALIYRLPLRESGYYHVRLWFFELCNCAVDPRSRVTDVVIDGTHVGTVDATAEAGWSQSLGRNFLTEVVNGELTIELQGVVRNPMLSGIEIFGPVHHTKLASAQSAVAASAPIIDEVAAYGIVEPVRRAISVSTGETFHLKYFSSEGSHRLNRRFSAALSGTKSGVNANRLFQLVTRRTEDTVPEDALVKIEDSCAARCATEVKCVGFYAQVAGFAYFCNGLSSLGVAVGTPTVSRSWSRAISPEYVTSSSLANDNGDVIGVDKTSDLWAGYGPDKLKTASFVAAFEGRSRYNKAGPWLSFSTAFQHHDRIFLANFTLPLCIEQCTRILSCIGLHFWEDPEITGYFQCAGLNNLGLKNGVETNLNSISLARTPFLMNKSRDDGMGNDFRDSGIDSAKINTSVQLSEKSFMSGGTSVVASFAGAGFVLVISLYIVRKRTRNRASRQDEIKLKLSSGEFLDLNHLVSPTIETDIQRERNEGPMTHWSTAWDEPDSEEGLSTFGLRDSPSSLSNILELSATLSRKEITHRLDNRDNHIHSDENNERHYQRMGLRQRSFVTPGLNVRMSPELAPTPRPLEKRASSLWELMCAGLLSPPKTSPTKPDEPLPPMPMDGLKPEVSPVLKFAETEI